MATAKITDLIAAKGDAPWVAFEYFPPRTPEGVANLYKRFTRMATQRAAAARARARAIARAALQPAPPALPPPPPQSPSTPTSLGARAARRRT